MSNFSDDGNVCLEDAGNTESPQSLKVLCVVLIVVFGLSLMVLGAVFVRRRKRFAIIKARSLILIGGLVFGGMYQVVLLIDILLDSKGIPCFLIGHTFLIIVAPTVVSTVAEVITFYFKVRLNQALANFELKSAVALGVDDRMAEVEDSNGPKRAKSVIKMKQYTLDKAIDQSESGVDNSSESSMCCCLGRSQARLEKKLGESTFDGSTAAGEIRYLVPKEDFPPNYLFLLSSKGFPKIIICVAFFLSVVLLVISIVNHKTCVSPCESFDIDARLTGAFCAIPTGVGLYFAYSIKDEPDPLKLKVDLLIANSISMIFGLSGSILYEANPNNIPLGLKYRYLLLWVLAVWGHILSRLAKPIWDSYQEEKLMKKGVLEVTLEDVLKTPTGRNLFKAFLVTEFSVENYLFWREVTDYRDNFSKRTKEENAALRKIIADLYLGDSAKMQVNTSGKILKKVQENLESDPESDDFEAMFDSVYAMMNDDSFTRFRSTSKYRSLLWENASQAIA